MTREESIYAFRNDPGSLTIGDLFELHQSLDAGIQDTRKIMAVIDDEIGKRERSAASARRSDPRLTQKVGDGK